MHFINFMAKSEPIINHLWLFTLIATAVLYVLCNVLPDRIAGNFLPLHNVFKPHTNVDLDYQSIGYAMLHTKWLARITHYTIFLDAILWFVIFQSWHWSISFIILFSIILQALFIGDKRFGLSFILTAIATYAGSCYFIQFLGMQDALLVSKVVLMLGGLIRMLGHSAELVPPLLLDKTDQFVKLSLKNINWKIPLVVILGYIGEFASGLPNRLFPVQINYLYQAIFRVRPQTTLSWKEIDLSAKKVLTGGYSKINALGNYYNSVINNDILTAETHQFVAATNITEE